MSDLFEDEEHVLVNDESFEEVALDSDDFDVTHGKVDARRRLESMLEEKRLREELDDSIDY